MSEHASNQHSNEIIEKDLDRLQFRQPVISDDHTEYGKPTGESDLDIYNRRLNLERSDDELKRSDRQWSIVTEAARRAIIADNTVRSTATALATYPLSEGLPKIAVEQLSTADPRIARMAKTSAATLGRRLSLAAVPDKVIAPDITNAPRLYDRKQAANSLALTVKYDSERYPRTLEHVADEIRVRPGISGAERKLVAQRYRYARDVKLLGLSAELHDHPIEINPADNPDEVLTHILPSGIKLGIKAEAYAANPDLLDPVAWKGRRQLKDRVYEVRIGGIDYIQKERKTTRHTDTKKNGHRDGLTSQQEFEVAQEFAGLGTIEQGDVSLRWEKPVGFVEFPDGYQFALFEKEPDLQDDSAPHDITRAIIDSKEAYQEEFDAVKEAAKIIYDERDDLLYKEVNKVSKAPLFQRVRKLLRGKSDATDAMNDDVAEDELTFDEFAELKAKSLRDEAKELLEHTMYKKGYVNSDLDGYAINVQKGDRVRLNIVGFDFEYYEKDPERAYEILQRIKLMQRSGERAMLIAGDRSIKSAAYYAMREQRGLSLPPRKQSDAA